MGNKNVRPVYDNINIYMIFDIRIDRKFTIKARLVAESYTTVPP